MELKFIADVHLGRLARWLRMLGFDTLYQNNFTRPELLRLAYEQQRVLLSRDQKLSNNPFIRTFILPEEDPERQLQQVVRHFNLQPQFHPLTLCLICNAPLHAVPMESVQHLLPGQTKKFFREFWQCPQCQRVFWKGSHYERMQQLMEQFVAK